MRVHPAVHREMVRQLWLGGRLSAWEAVRRLYNAGHRGLALNLLAR